MARWNKTVSSEMDLHIHSHVMNVYGKEVLEQPDMHTGKNVTPYVKLYTKVNLTWLTGLTTTVKTMKLLEKT